MLAPTGVAVIQWLPFNLSQQPPWVKTDKKLFVHQFNHINRFTSGTSKHHSLWWEISAGGAVRLCWWWWRRRGGPSRLSTTASILSLRRIPSMLIRWEQTLIILHDPQWFPMITNDPKWPEKVSIMHAIDALIQRKLNGSSDKRSENPQGKGISNFRYNIKSFTRRSTEGVQKQYYYLGSWSLSSPQFLEPSPTGWFDDSSNIFHSKDEKYIPFNVFHASSNIFTLN